MNYNEALNFIVSKQSLGIKPGLERISALLEAMGNPQNKLNIIHIAGTNGKGTIANTIAGTLAKAGYRAGLFTSPWVTDYREQIQINGSFISKDDFAEYVCRYQDADATEFELITAIMYKYFYDKGVDYAVVECGMGGKGDATNTEKKNISVITSVSLDHTAFLGDTVEKIALEKSGIIKQNGICVLYPNSECEFVFEEVCRKKSAKLIKVKETGEWLNNNLSVIKEVLKLVIGDCDFSVSQLPARKERIGDILLDGGHNTDAAKFLEISLSDNEVAVMGMMADKDIDGYLSVVAPKCRKIITTTPNNPRAIPAEELKKLAEKYCSDVIAINNPADAIKENGITLVCGSFFLARDIRKYLF